jgi:hypothetical protein
MIVGFPAEAHGCRQSITIVLPFVHGYVSAIGPFSNKVSCVTNSLKTNKVRDRNSPCVLMRGTTGVYPREV